MGLRDAKWLDRGSRRRDSARLRDLSWPIARDYVPARRRNRAIGHWFTVPIIGPVPEWISAIAAIIVSLFGLIFFRKPEGY